MHATIELPRKTWNPLPEGFYIGTSTVHGKGLFTNVFIPAGTTLGETHVYTTNELFLKLFPDGWIRNALGAWYNHSDTAANGESVHLGSAQHPQPGDCKTLRVVRDIHPGEEILVKYTLYVPYATKASNP